MLVLAARFRDGWALMSGRRGPPLRSGALPRSDEDLLIGLRRLESGSQAELYRRYARRVASVIRRLLGNDAELSDVVQETFAQALSGVTRFRGGGESLEAWLLRIAAFTARAQIRRRIRRRRVLVEQSDVELDVPATVATPAEIDAVRRACQVFDSMPEEESLPLALRLIHDSTLPEIAAACGYSESTIKRRLQRARRRFEKLAARDPALREWMSGWAARTRPSR